MGEILVRKLVNFETDLFISIMFELGCTKFGIDQKAIVYPLITLLDASLFQIMGLMIFFLLWSFPISVAMRSSLLNDVVCTWEKVHRIFSETSIGHYTWCFFGIGALVFEKVLISETRGPILRNRGPIQRNTVSLDRTSLFSSRKIVIFAHVEQHLNSMFGSLFIATFLLAMNGPRSVITCSRGSPEVSTGSYPF